MLVSSQSCGQSFESGERRVEEVSYEAFDRVGVCFGSGAPREREDGMDGIAARYRCRRIEYEQVSNVECRTGSRNDAERARFK